MDIKIVGTSHISSESVKEITHEIQTFQPDIVTVELDKGRAASLLQEQRSKVDLSLIARIGVTGYVFAKIGQFVQQKLGKVVGISPGSDMKAAILVAGKHKKTVALIDQPVQITLRKFSQNVTWREKGRFVIDVIKGLLFPKSQMKQMGLEKFDLTKVPAEKVTAKMMGQLKKRYPNVYKTLVVDRNKYMVKKLVTLLRAHPGKKILCVVGAGHKEGMEKLLLKVDVV